MGRPVLLSYSHLEPAVYLVRGGGGGYMFSTTHTMWVRQWANANPLKELWRISLKPCTVFSPVTATGSCHTNLRRCPLLFSVALRGKSTVSWSGW